MVSKSNRAAGAPLVLSDRNILLKGRRALDRRLVDLLVLVDGVGRAVAGEGALHGALTHGAAAVAFFHVVLHQRVLAPAVNGCDYRAGARGG